MKLHVFKRLTDSKKIDYPVTVALFANMNLSCSEMISVTIVTLLCFVFEEKAGNLRAFALMLKEV